MALAFKGINKRLMTDTAESHVQLPMSELDERFGSAEPNQSGGVYFFYIDPTERVLVNMIILLYDWLRLILIRTFLL